MNMNMTNVEIEASDERTRILLAHQWYDNVVLMYRVYAKAKEERNQDKQRELINDAAGYASFVVGYQFWIPRTRRDNLISVSPTLSVSHKQAEADAHNLLMYRSTITENNPYTDNGARRF